MRISGVVDVGTESLVRGGGLSRGLNASFGLPFQTNPWTDASNADLIFVLGSNPARSAPVAMRHIIAAKSRGAKLVTVDPVITETASISDLHCFIRPGADAVFLLGLVRQAIITSSVNRDYLIEYTDASCILRSDFDYDPAKSLFSGYDAARKRYNTETWEYERDERGNPRRDEELRNIRTVYQTLKHFVSRYTPSYVSQVTGCSEDHFLRAAEIFLSGVQSGRSSAIILGSGIDSQSISDQTARAASILQLLTGSIGVSGGGIFTLCGGANSRGVDDQIPSWHMMPGSISLPNVDEKVKEIDLVSYSKNNVSMSNDTMSINLWQYFRNYNVSLLKAWFGDHAIKEAHYGFDLLPKIQGAGTTERFFEKLSSGAVKGLFLLGGESLHRSGMKSDILSKCDWIVLSDIWSNDTSEFWNSSKAPQIKTEIFLFPSLSLAEKTGTITSSSRWVSYNEGLEEPNNQAKGELWFLNELFNRMKNLYRSGGSFPDPFIKASWNYGDGDDAAVRSEISGVSLSPGKPLSAASELMADGSTACGNFLYCGMNNRDEPSKSRDNGGSSPDTELYSSWAWSVPSNVRVLYNRAGVDRKGKVWPGQKAIVNLDKKRSWMDIPHGQGSAFEKHPFIMNRDGLGLLFAPSMPDGPFPDYNDLSDASKRRNSSIFAVHSGLEMSSVLRNVPSAFEWFPDSCCEISQTLASSLGLVQGDRVTLSSSKGAGSFICIVTPRLRPLVCEGNLLDVVSISGIDACTVLPLTISEGDLPFLSVEIKVSKKGGA
jgi:formate dehydrogenase major subunit